MRILKLSFYFFLLVAFSTEASCIKPVSTTSYTATGVAKNISGEIVYTEYHQYISDESRSTATVLYKDINNMLIAKKTVEYQCEFSSPAYQLEMSNQIDFSEQISWKSSDLIVDNNAGRKVLEINSRDNLVIDAGFDHFVAASWNSLISGVQKKFYFLHVPGKRLIELQIVHIPSPQVESYKVAENVEVFKINIASKLLRIFAKPIYLGYKQATKQLAFYIGPTNLRGEISGLMKSRQVTIDYEFN